MMCIGCGSHFQFGHSKGLVWRGHHAGWGGIGLGIPLVERCVVMESIEVHTKQCIPCICMDSHATHTSHRWVCQDFPELKLAVETHVLNDFDPNR